MADDCATPPGYAPGLRLSLREKCQGGELRQQVEQQPAPDPRTHTEIVVLVHGYNNTQADAAASYNGFRIRQYESIRGLASPALDNVLADTFWPGDADWGAVDFLDFLFYSDAVGVARSAGDRLAQHLRTMPGLVVVHFIGHSLGCRVVLEAIEHLRLSGGPAVGRVALMAAAVPVFKVEHGAALAAAMNHAERVLVLYSDDDTVLRYAFPPGQTLAGGDEGSFPTALGRQPTPAVAGLTERVRVAGADHGSYWGHQPGPVSGEGGRLAAEFLQLGERARVIPAREISAGAEMSAREVIADVREVGETRTV